MQNVDANVGNGPQSSTACQLENLAESRANCSNWKKKVKNKKKQCKREHSASQHHRMALAELR